MEQRNLFSAKNAKEAHFNKTLRHEPPDIYLDDHIMDVRFSPVANVIGLGQITGEVRLYTYNEKNNKEVLTFNYHTESCRQVVFSPDGNIVYTGASDGSIGVISNGQLEGRILGAHPSPINSLIHIQDNTIIATGDDDGLIKIWDLRQAATANKGCVLKFEDHEGTIMDQQLNDEGTMLLTACNDGHLGVFDLRKGSLYAMSDNFEEDLTALVICKYQKKVLASTSEGTINVFTWDWFGDCNDRIVGHPNSIDTMIKYDEDTVITGSEDGLIRAVSVLPNKIVAILSDATDESEVFHIQRVALSHDKCFLASVSLDDIVKIIDVSHLGSRVKEDFDEEEYERDLVANPKIKRKKKKVARQDGDVEMADEQQEEEKKGNESSSDDEGWESESSSDSDDSSSDDDKRGKNGKKDKKLNVKSNNVKKSQKMIDAQKRQDFFSDL